MAIFTGETVEDAIERGLNRLNVQQHCLEYLESIRDYPVECNPSSKVNPHNQDENRHDISH